MHIVFPDHRLLRHPRCSVKQTTGSFKTHLGQILYCLLAIACLLRSSELLAQDARHAADLQPVVDRLQQWYQPATGLWHTTGWWNSANAVTTLTDYARTANSTQYNDVLARTFAQTRFKGFLNDYYDDEGWWALAWIDGYDLTHNSEYLKMAEAIFENMAGGWDNTCNGGIWWSKERHYKNAIANELFLDVAAHLANRVRDVTRRKHYIDWADREWLWFTDSSVIAPDHQINDGLTLPAGTIKELSGAITRASSWVLLPNFPGNPAIANWFGRRSRLPMPLSST